MKMKQVARKDLRKLQKYLGLPYVPVSARIEEFKKGAKTLNVEWMEGVEVKGRECSQDLDVLSNLTFEEGREDSYEKGYARGFEEGREKGYKQGYATGFDAGLLVIKRGGNR